jgi:superfamily II DNA or RNA helicase
MQTIMGVIDTKRQTLTALEAAPPMFVLPRDDLLPTLIPAIGASSVLDCMMGFFASSSLAEIAPGLATYLAASQGPVRLLVSPIISVADQAALRDGLDPTTLIARHFEGSLPNADALSRHTLACLSWLIRERRLDMRFAFLKDGLFHPKVWLLNIEGQRLTFHGSSNMTGAGLGRNKEQMALARAWMDGCQAATEQRLRDEFIELWDGDDGDCIVVKLPRALEEQLLKTYGSGNRPTEAEATALWQRAKRRSNGAAKPADIDDVVSMPQTGFRIPEWLMWRDGPFAHQGRAVDAWLAADGRGILAMATGSGKTLTSLVACHELRARTGPLLIVIAAPYIPLVMQWCDEARLFGVEPRNLAAAGGPAARRREIADAGRRLTLGLSDTEVLVVSHGTLIDPGLTSALTRLSVPRVLIADEVHNLGSPGFLKNPPEFFEYRLGLSATPIRQYDPEGTDKLFDFFGRPCFEFSLEDAIGVCLVPYDYHVHRIELDGEEMEEFRDLSEKIRKLGWKIEAKIDDPQLDDLLRRRRLVVERARGKIAALAGLIDRASKADIRYDLVYATDKAPGQLDEVNELLRERGLLFHQLTAEETSDRGAVARILDAFQRGEIQVLTAKRVLDEGVNVPEIKRAFILASTTVERQWVQRRGRILRRCDAIGKDHGVIHDFVAIPPSELVTDADARQLVLGELKRVEEFARLARNYGAADGPLIMLKEMQAMVYV